MCGGWLPDVFLYLCVFFAFFPLEVESKGEGLALVGFVIHLLLNFVGETWNLGKKMCGGYFC